MRHSGKKKTKAMQESSNMLTRTCSSLKKIVLQTKNNAKSNNKTHRQSKWEAWPWTSNKRSTSARKKENWPRLSSSKRNFPSWLTKKTDAIKRSWWTTRFVRFLTKSKNLKSKKSRWSMTCSRHSMSIRNWLSSATPVALGCKAPGVALYRWRQIWTKK